jgi:hypothetical protein
VLFETLAAFAELPECQRVKAGAVVFDVDQDATRAKLRLQSHLAARRAAGVVDQITERFAQIVKVERYPQRLDDGKLQIQ